MKNLRVMVLGLAFFGFQASAVQADLLEDFIYADEGLQVLAIGDTYSATEVDFAAFTEEKAQKIEETKSEMK